MNLSIDIRPTQRWAGYTIGFEAAMRESTAGAEHPMTIRVTHIYRREDGEWKLVHRHADFPPKDPRG